MGKEQAKIKGKKRKALVIVVWEPDSLDIPPLVLLLKRPSREAGYLWQPVTGNLEKGEDFSEGALREASEETGLDFPNPPRFLGIRLEFEGRWGPAEEQGFSLIVTGKKPPKPKLDPKEHDDFAWLSPKEAIERVEFEQQKDAIARATYRPEPLLLSREGTFSQEGEEITHIRTSELLHRSLERKPQSKGYQVRIGEETLPVNVEGTARFVVQVDLEKGLITLASGKQYPLDPESLEIGKENAFYCKVDGEKARFTRSAHNRLAETVLENSDGSFSISWKKKVYAIKS
jgi:hypothetical protein